MQILTTANMNFRRKYHSLQPYAEMLQINPLARHDQNYLMCQKVFKGSIRFTNTRLQQSQTLVIYYSTVHLYTIVLRSFPFFNTKNIVDIWWPFLRNDELLFNVVLYLSAESLESLQPGEASSSANVLMTHCIRLLRERVAEPGLGTTNETIVAVANLMAIEHGKGNMRSLKMHMDGLKRMVTARGGLNALRDSSPMTANMAFWMSMIASNQPESLPLAFDTNDELHGSPSDRAITHLDSDEYNAEEATSVILQQANRMSQMFTVTVNSASTEEGLSVLDHLSSLIQTLLQLAPKADTDRTITRLLESCRYAAALHVFFPLCGFYPDPTLMVSTLVHDLKSSLEFYMVFLALHANLVLWMFFVGGVSAWAMPERAWFVGHLVVMTEDFGIQTWEQMRNRLTSVVWYAVFCEDSFRKLWGEVETKSRILNAQSSSSS
ncbi:MAG: hypothetical protein M1820_002802 [Bogoriella megaspora]|nr:MAG: hypothetical protein M1820_002802 [Bogoriella megaspora]